MSGQQSSNDRRDDLGFGNRTGSGRNMNRDGSYNIKRLGEPRLRSYEWYHDLITMKWTRFIGVVLISYIIANTIFATVYFWLGVEHLSGIEPHLAEWRKFAEAYFFSSQTLTTLGYGRIAPVGFWTSLVAAIESMLGLIGFALATGLLYGRFSRPNAKILFSSNALITPYRGGRALMFRLVNQRHSQLIEVEVEVTLTINNTVSGQREYHPLTLERRRIALFPLSWTIVHPMDQDSPLFNATVKELFDREIEIIVVIKAFDDTFSQTIYQRTSYRADEIMEGAKFVPMFTRSESGDTTLNFALIDAHEKSELP